MFYKGIFPAQKLKKLNLIKMTKSSTENRNIKFFLQVMNAVLIFGSKAEFDQSIYYSILYSDLR